MKKVILVSLVLIFVFCSFSISTKGQSDTDAGDVAVGIFLGSIEDELIQESAQEMKQIAKELAKAAKESGATKSVLPFVNSLSRNAKELVRTSQHLSVKKCDNSATFREANVQIIISKANKLQEKLCSNVNAARVDVTFYPMAKHCIIGSPNFQKCLCGHHPGSPGCGGTSSMSGGMHGGSEPSEPKEPECISDEDFASRLTRLEDIFNELVSTLTKDSNGNGLPDFCENNKKPMERKHGGKKKPKKPKHGGMMG